MSVTRKILILPGDGIGPEVMREARRVLDWLERRRGLQFELEEDLVGRRRHRCAWRAAGR